MNSDPYMSSKRARATGPWYDSFAKSGSVVWIVFDGPQLLAEVKNEQQAINVVTAIVANSMITGMANSQSYL